MNDYDIYSEPIAIWYRSPIVYIGAGVTIGLFALAFILMTLIGGEPLSEETKQAVVAIEETTQTECAEDENAEGCKIDVVYQNAKDLGSIELCSVLDDSDIADRCILSVARKWDRPEYCEEISDRELSENCFSMLYFFLALEEQNEEYCLKIPDEESKDSCHLRFDGPLSQENCRERLSETAYCDDLDTIAHAALTSNSHLCYQLDTIDGWAECIRQVGYPDDDGDGLTLADEDYLGTSDFNEDSDSDALDDYSEVKEYVTNPLDEDTDGDSFLDGAEVAQGYNPNGEGRL